MQKLFLIRHAKGLCVTFYAFILLTLFTTSCNNNLPDVSGITVELDLQRFEQDLFAADSSNYAQVFENLSKQYPAFFDNYVSQILSIGQTADSAWQKPLLGFISNVNIQALHDSVLQKYPTTTTIETEFTEAFKYYRYYHPNKKIPRVITHLSEFGPAALSLDSTFIGVNLDMYLGEDFVYYPSIGIPKYIRRTLEPEYIVKNAMLAYAKGLYPFEAKQARLIDHMIYEGKLLYFLDQVLPEVHDTIKIGYTNTKLDWCKNSKASIWAFMLDQELLYNSRAMAYQKFIQWAPTTNGMPSESPGRVGVWLGWQIVRAYMQKHPNTSFDELMAISDGQLLLQKSKFKPIR